MSRLQVLLVGLLCLRYSYTDAVPSVDCQSQPQASYPFCDTTRSPEDRATDLVSRLNTDELIAQTSSIAPAISRLGIKDYNWRSNCIHGWSKSGGHWTSDLKWTVFAAPIGLAATFDAPLIQEVGSATSDEGRALHNLMLASNNGSSTEAAGLNCFSPNVNLFRDPRWGRGQETFGEDPYLLSVTSVAYTRGLQEGDDNKYIKIGACAKHYAVHSGPDQLRAHFTANASLHDLYDTYLPAFKSQVQAAKVTQMMPAYSGLRCKGSMNGAPNTANPFLLKTILREEFAAPNISIISDNGGVIEVYNTHHFAATLEDAAALCMNASNDLDLGHDDVYPKYLPQAVKDGKVSIDSIKSAVWRSFLLRIRLGDFDPLSMVKYQNIGADSLNTVANHKLNLLSAQESIVLLKNKHNTLPLSGNSSMKLAIIGPNANDTGVLLSNYEGIPDKVVTIQEGITTELVGSGMELSSALGCKAISCPDKSGFDDAINVAKGADYVILVLGLQGSLEGEGHDRATTKCEGDEQDVLALPGCQGALVDSILTVNRKVILVLLNGGPLSIQDQLQNDGVLAILEAFYPGALGGTAVASVLFGKYNPAGRMPITTVTSSKELPIATNYNMSCTPGRTYRYYNNKPLIPFGFGLSYTSFRYSNMMLPTSTIAQCNSIKMSVTVQNTGDMSGDEVVQVYISPKSLPHLEPFFPNIQLVGFERINNIVKGASHSITFEINPYLLSLVADDGINYIFPGSYNISVGGCLPVESMIEHCMSLSAEFSITGTSPVPVSSCKESPQCLACDE